MTRKYIALLSLLAFPLPVIHADIVDDYAPGRSGEALKNTLSRHCRPSVLIDESRITEYLLDIYDSGNGVTIDALSGKPIEDPDFAAATLIIPAEWMKTSPQYHAEASTDLYNMLITEASTAIDRGQLPLCDKTEGYDYVTPPDGMKGDVARAIFYIATLYPCQLWGSWGKGIFDNTGYPTLRKEWSEHYLKWHREDPVDTQELIRGNKIAGLQGNQNPFVTHPELAEYLWGNKSGETFMPTETPENPKPGDTENPDDPIADTEPRTPLRKSYDANDKYIYLYSPYVPDNVTWSIDGSNISGRIEVASLSIGTHELRYISDNVKGKLLIEIKP